MTRLGDLTTSDVTTSYLTTSDLASRSLTVLIPVGSCEQHGPHLPLNTDARVAEAVAVAAAAGRFGVVIAPTLPYSASDEHAGFPGLLSLGADGTHAALHALVRSAREWATHVVIVNGHGGNSSALRRLEGEASLWSPRYRGDAHAGHSETSLMLAIDPAAVRLDRLAVGTTDPVAMLMPMMRTGGVRAVSTSGVLGDPTTATAAAGAQLLEALVTDLRALLDALPG